MVFGGKVPHPPPTMRTGPHTSANKASLLLLSLQLCLATAPDHHDHDDRKLWSGVASSSDGMRLTAVVGGYRGAGGHIYLSADAGKSWSSAYIVRSWRAVASSASGTLLVAVEDSSEEREGGYIHTSTDAGLSWTVQKGAGCRHWLSVASSSDGRRLAAVVGGYTGTGIRRLQGCRPGNAASSSRRSN